MILNFYLCKPQPIGAMRKVEWENLKKVRAKSESKGHLCNLQVTKIPHFPILLKRQGVRNTGKLDYHEAIQTLAKRVSEECAGHRMRKAGTGHRLTTAGIAGDNLFRTVFGTHNARNPETRHET